MRLQTWTLRWPPQSLTSGPTQVWSAADGAREREREAARRAAAAAAAEAAEQKMAAEAAAAAVEQQALAEAALAQAAAAGTFAASRSGPTAGPSSAAVHGPAVQAAHKCSASQNLAVGWPLMGHDVNRVIQIWPKQDTSYRHAARVRFSPGVC